MDCTIYAAYQDGRDARDAGEDTDANPHPKGPGPTRLNQDRYLWYQGWFDRDHEIRLKVLSHE